MGQNFYYPNINVPTYPNAASLPVSPPDGTLAVTTDTDTVYVFNALTSTWVAIGGASVPLGMGAFDGQPESNAGASIAANMLFMQSADATHPGLVNTGVQTFAGAKTFTGAISASNLSGTNTGDVTLGTASGLSLAGQVLSLGLSSSSTTGALSNTDWNTFNSKLSSLSLAQYVFVTKNGNDLTAAVGRLDLPCLTINKAMSLITDASSSKYYVIKVGPGSYTETSLAIKPYVWISGESNLYAGATAVTVTGGNITLDPLFATQAGRCGLLNLSITSPSGINFDAQAIGGALSVVTQLHNVSVGANLVWKGKNTNDFFSFDDGFVFGTTTLSGGTTGITNVNMVGNVQTDTSGAANITVLIAGGICYADLKATSSGINTNTTELAACATSTLHVDGANTGFYSDSVSLPSPASNITLTNSGVINRLTDTFSVAYFPTTSANWLVAPSVTQNALDTLAASGIVKSQSQNLVFASPNGSSGLGSFRSLVKADIPSILNSQDVWVDTMAGSDITGDGSYQRPWLTLGHAAVTINPNINSPIVIHMVGKADNSVAPITCPPNVVITSDFIGFQINQPITFSGPGLPLNDTVSLVNLQLFSTLSWTRNDATQIQMLLLNTNVDGATTFKQNGSGKSQSFFIAQLGALGGLDILASQASLTNTEIFGAITFEDAGSGTYLIIENSDIAAAVSMSGGVTAYFTGCNADIGYSLTGTATGSGTPAIIADAGSLPPTISGAYTIAQLNSHAQYEAYAPATPGNWSPSPSQVASALDQLAARVPVGGAGTVTSVALTAPAWLTVTGSPITTSGTLAITGTSEAANQFLASPNGSAGAMTPRAIVAADIPALPYASSTLTNTHIFVGNGSNVATDVTASGDLTLANTGAFTIANNAVSNAKLAQMPTVTIKGNNTGGTANALDLTVAQVNTMLGDILANGTVPFTADQSMGSHKLTNVTDPSSAQDAATKAYVDAGLAALNPYASVYAATTGSNIVGTYNNGAAGVGATFTVTATGAFSVDGVTPPLNSRVLIKDQTSGFQNGIYTLTTAGSLGVSPIFTRASDYNTPADMNGAGLIPVINGTLNALSSWQQVASITTVGTDSLVFDEFTANPSLYLLKANNLSDVASKSASFDNLSPMTTLGDIIYGGASGTGTRLGIGGANQVLQVSGGIPSWQTITLSGVATIGAIDGQAKSANALVISGSSIYAQTADASFPGVVSTGVQTFAGAKTFTGAISASNLSGTNTGDQTITLTGDVTGNGTGSFATTLATVNANVGSFGSSTSIPSFTVNAKGLITAASGNAVIAPAGTLSGTTLASNVVSSSLTSVGTITSGTWNGTTVDIAHGGTGQVTAGAAFDALSPLTTKGDILAYSTTNARLPVGSDGQVLTADSAQTLGVKWATPTTGTVTSVALTVPSFLSVSGSPITSSGTLAVTLSGTALPVANGGTGDTSTTAYGVLTGGTTSTGAFQNAGTGTSGQVLTSNGSSALPTWNSPLRTINAQSGTTYTFVLSDGSGAGGDPLVTFGSGSATTVTVPTNASVAFPVGTQIDCIQQGAGKVTFAGAGGVTINSNGANLSIFAQYVAVTLIKTATDTWTLIGNLTT